MSSTNSPRPAPGPAPCVSTPATRPGMAQPAPHLTEPFLPDADTDVVAEAQGACASFAAVCRAALSVAAQRVFGAGYIP